MSGRSRAVFLAAFAVACGRVDSPPADDAAVDAGASDDASAFADGTYSPPDATPEAAPPPLVACDDAGTCPLPPSQCVDSQRLEYFDNGVCAEGNCHYDAVVYDCVWGCFDGGCGSRITTPNVSPRP